MHFRFARQAAQLVTLRYTPAAAYMGASIWLTEKADGIPLISWRPRMSINSLFFMQNFETTL